MEKKLYRLKYDRKICGVCSGVAAYLGVDVTIVRLLWVLGTFIFVGTGLFLYIVCLFIMPEEPDYYDGQYREK